MRFRLAVLVAVTSVLTVVSPALASPLPAQAGHSVATDLQYVRHELYEVPMRQFVADARTGNRWFDWSTDFCSSAATAVGTRSGTPPNAARSTSSSWPT